MRFKVPKNVDIEDRIVGSLTGKQFLWLIGGAVLLFPIYHLADFSLFVISGLAIMGISAALTFVRPYSQSLFTFTTNFLLYNVKGKQYVWKRTDRQFNNEELARKEQPDVTVVKKGFPEDKVSQLAHVLDTEGNIRNTSAYDKLFYGKDDQSQKTSPKEEAALPEEEYELNSNSVSSDITRARLRNQERTNTLGQSADNKNAEMTLLGLEKKK